MSITTQAPKPEKVDADGVALIERPNKFAKLLHMLGERDAVTVAGAPGDPRRIRVTLVA